MRTILPEEIAPSNLYHRVGIDDSVEIPVVDPEAYAAAFLLGAVEGVFNATAATLWGVVDLVNLPFTTYRANSEFQAQVWASFSAEEKDAFVNDAGLLAYSVLIRNAEMGARDAGELLKAVRASTFQAMKDMEQDWAIGDYTSTVQNYTRFASDSIAQVAVPIALAKMAKSPAAVAALNRAQRGLQTAGAPLLARLQTVERLEELGPILTALESGLELLPDQLAVLAGISPEELTELQKLATKYNFLLTVRSRHASSIEWIKQLALLKPEAIKIKSVIELDVKLGYRESDIGSLVFRKPEVLRQFEAGQGNVDELFDEFLRSKGFSKGTGDWENASVRLMDRIEEWQKYESTYKSWNARGWIEVSFNYLGNAISKDVRKGGGQFRGFKLDATGRPQDEFVMKMMDGKRGKFVPITGDIDPIAFTHLDGSPLTAVEHADLLDDFRKNPALQGQHGESATFVKGGVEFVLNQFKPNEPGFQIAPGSHAPRVVRLNSGKSRWASPFDYHLHFDGGFVYSGTFLPRGAIPAPSRVVPPATLRPDLKPRPLPRSVGSAPNVGRCIVSYNNDSDAKALIFDEEGRIAESVDGEFRKSPLADQCFTEGETLAVNTSPSTEVLGGSDSGDNRINIGEEPYLADPTTGLEVGQQIIVGAGTDHAEARTIAGFGSIILDRPLDSGHDAGEVIVVLPRAVVAADLSISKTVAPTGAVTAGATLTYRLSLTNSGPSDATDVSATDTLPPELSFTGASPGCTNSSGRVTCSIGLLPNGETVTRTITVTASTAGTMTNVASVGGSLDDPNASNDQSSVTTTVNPAPVFGPDLVLTKTAAPETAVVGKPLTYTLTVKNNGPGFATGVKVVDTLPAGLTAVSARTFGGRCSVTGGLVTCSYRRLVPGVPTVVTIKATPSEAGLLKNAAAVTGDQPDPRPANNTATFETNVTAAPVIANLSLSTKSTPNFVRKGGTVAFNLTVKNRGPAVATQVVVTDNLPEGMTFLSVTSDRGGCNEAAGTVTCEVGTLNNGASANVVLKVLATRPGLILNSPTVTAQQTDPSPADNKRSSLTFVF